MRSDTAAQATALGSKYYTAGLRVLVADADANLRDWSNQAGRNWIISVEIDLDIDQPVNGATVTLRRDAGATLSLSPLRTDSTLNRNNASAFAPAVDDGRLIIVQVATVTANTVPGTMDFVELFRGAIDRVTFAAGTMPLVVRDIGNVNADRYVKTKTVYGTDTGVPLESVAQAIITDWGDGSTLYLPNGSPSFNITTFEQQANQSVVDALLALAQTCGWAIRTLWNPTAGAFQLALVDPQRTKTTPDQTIAPSRILAVSDLFIDRTQVRNDFTLNYTDVSTGPTSMALSDGASQAAYGYRWMGITESSTSPINTGTEALAMLTAIRADLKDPKAEQEIEMHLDWRIELGDLLQFTADGIHFDTDQTGAVVSVKHVLTPTSYRTIVRTRGAPAGQYLNWRERGVGTPLTQGPNLAVSAKQSGTNYVITWSGDRVQLSTDGGTTWATPGTSPITVAMNAPGGVSKVYVFQGYRDGVATSVVVTIPAQSGSTAPSLSLTPSIASTQVDDSSSAVTLTLGASNLPTAYAWTLYSGYTRGKLTTTLASGTQSSNPLSGNPTVSVSPQAKLFTWCTLVVTIGSDTYRADVVINPYQPAFSTGGAVKRAVPFDDGNYAPRAVDSSGLNLHVGVTDSSGRTIAGMFHKPTETLDNINDGPTYFKTNQNQRDGGGRAYTGLNGSGRVVTGVEAAADVGGKRGSNVAAGSSTTTWSETFDTSPVADARWSNLNPVYAAHLANNSNSTKGSGCLNITGAELDPVWQYPFPFDPRKLYRMRASMLCFADGANTAQQAVFVGVRCLLADGSVANNNGGNAYVCAQNVPLLAAGGRQTFTGWFRGASLAYASGSPTHSADPTAPTALSVNTAQIQPLFIVNFSGGTSNVILDFFDITEFDEDGSARTYANFSGVGAIAGGVNQIDSGSNRPMMRGYQVQQLAHGANVVFSPSYVNPPKYRITGGTKQDPRAVYGPTGSGSESGAANAALPQIEDFGLSGLSASGATLRARIRQPGTTVAHADAWGSTAAGAGAVTSTAHPSATSNNDTYSVDGSTSLQLAYDPAVGGRQSCSMTVALDVDDAGTGNWVERATQTVTVSGFANTTANPALNLSVVRAGLSASSGFRVRIKTIDEGNAGGATGSATAAHLNYTTAAGDQYTSATRDTGVLVTVETWEGDSAV